MGTRFLKQIDTLPVEIRAGPAPGSSLFTFDFAPKLHNNLPRTRPRNKPELHKSNKLSSGLFTTPNKIESASTIPPIKRAGADFTASESA
jgi:hypothetical protein